MGDEGEAVTHFESRKTAALLACLALHPERSHSREELAALIWPDADDVSGRNRLKQSLASLKKQLGEFFDADRFAVRVVAGSLETDASEWERLARAGRTREARELWRGELLPGFYDEFLLSERERLNALKESLCPEDRTPARREVRLPAPTTRFVGRDDELARLAALLQSERWITIVGPGGMGKTRLALQVARGWEEGDAVFVALADLPQAGGVLATIAAALELPLPPAKDPLETLCAFLKDRPILLLLDNAEHLELPALASLCGSLLACLPELRLLATSRQALGGEGETRFPLGSLSAEASALFLDRARRVRPDFPETEEIAPLCALLEGMPLAIELCAAWAGALSAAQMRARLERNERFLLLTRRGVGVEERHRSVEAVFLSSYASLTAGQQALLRALSVFRGGWTLEAAEAVRPTDEGLSDLAALLDASLIFPIGPERFTMLESLRQFAAGLLAPGEAESLQICHWDWCRSLARQGGDEAEREYVERCDRERENLRHALESGLSQGRGARIAPLFLDLQRFFNLRGYNGELTGWLELLLATPGLSDVMRGELLLHLGGTLLEQQDQFRAEKLLHEALALARAASQEELEALALYHLGRFAELQRLPELARERHEHALALRRRVGDTAGIARSCNALALFAIQGGAMDEAGELLREADALARAAGRESLLGDILYQRAHLTMMSGDAPGALALLEECQEQARRFGLRPLLGRVTHSLGCTAQEMGDDWRARAAYLEAAQTFHAQGSKLGTTYPLWCLARLYSDWEEWDVALLALGCSLRLSDQLAQTISEEYQLERGRPASARERRAGTAARRAPLAAGQDALGRGDPRPDRSPPASQIQRSLASLRFLYAPPIRSCHSRLRVRRSH